MITLDELKRLFIYNPNTGIFIWKLAIGHRIKAGDIAGSVNGYGYVHIQINKKVYKAHRLAFLYMTGKWPEKFIDHINGVKSDNKWANLREASHGQNQQNKNIQKNKKVAVKGLTYREATYNRAAIYIANVKCLGVAYTKAISVINRLDEDIIEELSIWLENTRKELHKEFTNNGNDYD